MSVPISAMMSWAAVVPTPGISSSWATWASSMARPEAPKMSLITTDSLIWASSGVSRRAAFPGPFLGQGAPVADQVP